MALTKARHFTKEQIQVAEIAKAISHPARVAILQILSKKDICICGDITAKLPLAQSTVSQHLKALKNAGIIKGEIDGPRTCYCIHKKNLQELRQVFLELFDAFQLDDECC